MLGKRARVEYDTPDLPSHADRKQWLESQHAAFDAVAAADEDEPPRGGGAAEPPAVPTQGAGEGGAPAEGGGGAAAAGEAGRDEVGDAGASRAQRRRSAAQHAAIFGLVYGLLEEGDDRRWGPGCCWGCELGCRCCTGPEWSGVQPPAEICCLEPMPACLGPSLLPQPTRRARRFAYLGSFCRNQLNPPPPRSPAPLSPRSFNEVYLPWLNDLPRQRLEAEFSTLHAYLRLLRGGMTHETVRGLMAAYVRAVIAKASGAAR